MESVALVAPVREMIMSVLLSRLTSANARILGTVVDNEKVTAVEKEIKPDELIFL